MQTAFLGDVVLSTPVITALHKCIPDIELSVMTTPLARPLIEYDPLVSRVIVFDKRGAHRGVRGFLNMVGELRSHRFERAYSLHRSARTALLLRASGISDRIGFSNAKLRFLYTRIKNRPAELHDVLRNISIVSGEGTSDSEPVVLRLSVSNSTFDSPLVQKALNNGDPYLVLMPGSEWETKRWHWQGFRHVAEFWLKKGYRVILLGGPREREISVLVANDLAIENLAGKTTLQELMAIISKAAVVVCNDSMAQHVASAFGVPVVPVFCATSPSFGFGPWRGPSRIIEDLSLSCRPCRRHGSRACPLGTEACMRVPAERVIEGVAELLARRGAIVCE